MWGDFFVQKAIQSIHKKNPCLKKLEKQGFLEMYEHINK